MKTFKIFEKNIKVNIGNIQNIPDKHSKHSNKTQKSLKFNIKKQIFWNKKKI